jgi:hypothetical protein
MRTRHFSFLIKLLPALLLIIAADRLFHHEVGSWFGGWTLAWIGLLLLARPALRRGSALVACAIAAAFALTMASDPGPLAWAMFWAALSIAALLPRTAGFDDAWRWGMRLLAHGLSGPLTPIHDLLRLLRHRPTRGRPTIRSVGAMLALPLVTTALFVALFATANPLIGNAFLAIELPSVGQIFFWLFVLVVVWPSLRPSRFATRFGMSAPEPEIRLPGSSVPSVLISLALFNVVFAIQNGLDIAFLWSGAPLPTGVTMTEYVHRGAYPLIATALLAGIFVLGTLKPGSATAANPAIRRLVVAWVAQNVLLVASSALRTFDYIATSELTPWRIAALVWMALVALGLVLICWRMLAGRSARWLINSNALAATIVLAASTVVDFQAMSAAWNVRHAREAGGGAGALDLCFLYRMGAPALLPLIELEQRPLTPEFRDRVRSVRQQIQYGDAIWGSKGVVQYQADWGSWTWHNALRLAEARRRLGNAPDAPVATPKGHSRDCDGAIVQLDPTVVAADH